MLATVWQLPSSSPDVAACRQCQTPNVLISLGKLFVRNLEAMIFQGRQIIEKLFKDETGRVVLHS